MRKAGLRKQIWARFEAIHPCPGMLTNTQLLTAWVIVQALVDIAEPKIITRKGASENWVWAAASREKRRIEAIKWINQGGDRFRVMCLMCFVDRRDVRQLMREIIEENDARNNPTN